MASNYSIVALNHRSIYEAYKKISDKDHRKEANIFRSVLKNTGLSPFSLMIALSAQRKPDIKIMYTHCARMIKVILVTQIMAFTYLISILGVTSTS